MKYFEFQLVVQEQMLFKDISNLELLLPLRSAEQNHLCNFGRRHHQELLLLNNSRTGADLFRF